MTVFLSIGSNIDPKKNIPAALILLKKKFRLKKVSSVYETDPVGPAGDQKFWNLAVELETLLDRKKLVSQLRGIEEALGRRRHAADRFAARTIDLDLLPQPGYALQAFTMIPLAEIAPDAVDAGTGKSFGELAGDLKKGSEKFKRIISAECRI